MKHNEEEYYRTLDAYQLNKRDVEYVMNILRAGTVTWASRNNCLNRGRRRRHVGNHKNGNEKFLWERKCDGECDRWFLQKDNMLQVDHIVEVGPFNGDWNDFVKRMYCPESNLQALCMSCHAKKTSNYNATLRFKRKNETSRVMSMEDALKEL